MTASSPTVAPSTAERAMEYLNHLEEAFIGSVLACGYLDKPQMIASIDTWFRADYLFGTQWRQAYQAITKLFSDNAPVAPVTLIKHLLDTDITHGELGKLIDEYALSWHHLDYLANEVYGEWRRRSLAAELVTTSGQLEEREIESDRAIDQIGELGNRYAPLLKDRSFTNREVIRQIFEGETQVQDCVSTGITELDDILRGGMAPGQVIIVAGRTSHGKSSLATHIAAHAIFAGEVRGTFVSLEMTNREVIERIISWRANGALPRSDAWQEAANQMRMREDALQICNSTHEISQVESMIRSYVRHRDHKFAVVDYLQLLRSRGHRRREEEVADVSRRLKQLAMSCGIPIVALAQLNRQADDQTPRISHIRESGAIEQDANVIVLIVPSEGFRKSDRVSQMQLVVAKNRNGAAGVVTVQWDKQSNYYRCESTEDGGGQQGDFDDWNDDGGSEFQ